MMPIGVPRVPYRSQREGSWQWVDIWNCLVRFSHRVSIRPGRLWPGIFADWASKLKKCHKCDSDIEHRFLSPSVACRHTRPQVLL